MQDNMAYLFAAEEDAEDSAVDSVKSTVVISAQSADTVMRRMIDAGVDVPVSSGELAVVLYGKATSGTRDNMRDIIAAIQENILNAPKLSPKFYFPYHYSHGFWAVKVFSSKEQAREQKEKEYKSPPRKRTAR